MKPKGIPRRLKGFRSGVNGYSGVSKYITTITTARLRISESVEVNNPLSNPTQTITESVAVVVT